MKPTKVDWTFNLDSCDSTSSPQKAPSNLQRVPPPFPPQPKNGKSVGTGMCTPSNLLKLTKNLPSATDASCVCQDQAASDPKTCGGLRPNGTCRNIPENVKCSPLHSSTPPPLSFALAQDLASARPISPSSPPHLSNYKFSPFVDNFLRPILENGRHRSIVLSNNIGVLGAGVVSEFFPHSFRNLFRVACIRIVVA